MRRRGARSALVLIACASAAASLIAARPSGAGQRGAAARSGEATGALPSAERPAPARQPSAQGAASAPRPSADAQTGDRAAFDEVRAEFLAALEAIRTGAPPAIDARLRAYALFPYLEAARVERALEDASATDSAADRDAAAFLAAHGAEPVGRDVLEAWLESLARRKQWKAFLAHYDAGGADQALRCRALEARIGLGRTHGLAAAIAHIWLTPEQLPPECEAPFDWLRAQGALTDDLIERRVELLLENGRADFARIIARALPDRRAAPLLRWAALLSEPRETIDALLAGPSSGVRLEALEAGWQRLARDEPAAALERYAPLVAGLGLDAAAASRLARALALGLAWDRRPEALEYFARVADADLDDYALAWRTRAALWAGDWALAARSIDGMSRDERLESRWRYWRARAAEQLHDRAQARGLYGSILDRDDYYAALAAARLGRAYAPHAEPLPADERVIRRLAALPALVRARELYYAGLPWHAAAEWRFGSHGLDAAARIQTVRLTARWGWYDMAIATASRRGVFNAYDVLYPRPYESAVGAAASLTKLEPALIYAVIRQESLYRPDAASAAGAVGLTQVMPATARRIAAAWNEPEPQRADLLTPAVNIKLGAAELRDLVSRFEEQLPVGLAAYNAGPNAAERWLPERPLPADVLDREHPFQRDARVRAARALAQPGLPLARHRPAADLAALARDGRAPRPGRGGHAGRALSAPGL